MDAGRLLLDAAGWGSAHYEIQECPYLVKPTAGAFDNGERPVNIGQSNMAWISSDEISWIKNDNIQIVRLWNDPSCTLKTALVKLPAGYEGAIDSRAAALKVIVIKGSLNYSDKTLEPGSYFGSEGTCRHRISNKSSEDVIMYVRANGKYFIKK